jgi:hypothetical protein
MLGAAPAGAALAATTRALAHKASTLRTASHSTDWLHQKRFSWLDTRTSGTAEGSLFRASAVG